MSQEKDINFFKVDIAGKHIEIECIHMQVFNMCRKYLAKFDEPDFVVIESQDAIEKERESKEDKYSDAYLETIAVYRRIAEKMLDYSTLLLHGVAVAVDNNCYILLAESGIGKTTQLINWLGNVAGSFPVNGDKPLVNVDDLLVYGTPWSGKENLNTNTAVPLAGICILERLDNDEEPSIKQISFSDAFSDIIKQTYIPNDSDGKRKVIELLGKLHEAHFFKMRCDSRIPESAIMAYEYMSKGSR